MSHQGWRHCGYWLEAHHYDAISQEKDSGEWIFPSFQFHWVALRKEFRRRNYNTSARSECRMYLSSAMHFSCVCCRMFLWERGGRDKGFHFCLKCCWDNNRPIFNHLSPYITNSSQRRRLPFHTAVLSGSINVYTGIQMYRGQCIF